MAALAYLPVALASFVTWVKWFHAVHDVAVARRCTRFTGTWWAWAWLVPGVNAVVPFVMARDLWRAGDPPGLRRPLPGLLRLWWAAMVVSTFAGFVAPFGVVAIFGSGGGVSDVLPLLSLLSSIGFYAFLGLSIEVVPQLTEHAVGLSQPHSEGVEPPSTAIAQPVR